MDQTLAIILNIIIMAALVYVLFLMQKKHYSFTVRVLTALLAGIIYGAILQLLLGTKSPVVKGANDWFAVISSGYVRLLKMIVIPLIFVAITSAIINLKDSKNLRKISILIISTLVITAGISAAVGAGFANIFGLNAGSLSAGQSELSAEKNMETSLTDFKAKPIEQQIIEIVPTNPFYSMTGQGSSATLSVVFFAAILGIATLSLRKKNAETAAFFTKIINTLNTVVMKIVTMILKLTPYGILALMTKMVSTSNFSEILRLIQFVLASYAAIIVMFLVHLLILSLNRINPVIYMRKSITALTFAFTSRTSAGTLPITVDTLINKMGVPEGQANLSASLGTSIGQNGCAGIYPAMLAVMIAPTVGINPLAPAFLIKLIIITAISSFGIAGVGGGATFAALTVLSAMGLPVGLVGLLIAIEPLIDMARTALNVSDAMVAGLISSKYMNELNKDIYNSN
ncbi:L-cystine transporter [Candidatus Clostridium radicumherbarum]|uniref:L-cystine uptake protein TcyP n=1 Tax=Candidatus Clostridium radicumherbarum TaxID=3381662 RepID=A0ABW8TXR7_9CLOT